METDFTDTDAAITSALKESGEPSARFFAYGHLPPHLRATSRKFAQLAVDGILALPRSAERAVALRKLLECKDAAVRAALPE